MSSSSSPSSPSTLVETLGEPSQEAAVPDSHPPVLGDMALTQQLLGVHHQLLLHWRLEILLLGVGVLPGKFNVKKGDVKWKYLNSALLKTFSPQPRVTPSSSSSCLLTGVELGMEGVGTEGEEDRKGKC